MFSNVGGKIKKLAVVLCILGIIASIAYAIVCFTNSNRYQNLTLYGILTLVGGCLLSWIGSFFVYGFGELIDRASSIDDRLARGGRGGGNRADTLRQMRDEGLLTEEEYRERLNGR